MAREARHSSAEGPAAGESLGADRDLCAGQEQQRGGANDTVFYGRHRHAAQGAERAAEADRGSWV